MNKKQKYVNRWKQQHEHLEKQSKPNEKSKATERRDEICRLNGWSQATFYRKLDYPESLSPSEKKTVAEVYDMPVHFLFLEMDPEHA